MSTDEWEEVKRLAGDLQRAQAASTAERLSERNCVEIVSKLIELKLLDVYFTNDARQYVTPARLSQEIQDELYVAGGRLSVGDLSTALNVDFSRVEERAGELARQGKFQICMGQVLTSDYLDRVAEEMNERLQQDGVVNLTRITKNIDLPTDFLRKEMEKRVKTILIGRQDETDQNLFLTDAYIARNRAKIRGALSGVTRPTRCAQIISQHGLSEAMFHGVAEELLRTKRIAGVISGGRQSANSVFIPELHSHAQTSWVLQSFQRNGYIEYDAVARLGITDAKNFIKRVVGGGDADELEFLRSACVGKGILSQVEAGIQEEFSNGDWVDVEAILPPSLSPEDGEDVVRAVLKQWEARGQKVPRILGKSLLVSEALSQRVLDELLPLVEEKARDDVSKGLFKLDPRSAAAKAKSSAAAARKPAATFGDDDDDDDDFSGRRGGQKKKDERRKKAASGKAGGGAQGRETKTKSTKKKYMAGKGGGGAADDSDGEDYAEDEESREHGSAGGGPVDDGLDFLPHKDLVARVKNLQLMSGAPGVLADKLANELKKALNTRYRELGRSLAAAANPSSASDVKNRLIADLKATASDSLANVRLFARGAAAVAESDKDLGAQLNRHLCKTLVAQLANKVLCYLVWTSEDVGGVGDGDGGRSKVVEDIVGGAKVADAASAADVWENISPEARAKLIQALPSEMKPELTKLTKAVAGDDPEAAAKELETALGPGYCEILFKKPDKKRDKQLLSGHRASLCSKLGECRDPALCLHLALLILFQSMTQQILHASGKFVPQILQFLRPELEKSGVYELLFRYQGLVMKSLGSGEGSAEAAAELDELTPQVQEAAVSTKKVHESS